MGRREERKQTVFTYARPGFFPCFSVNCLVVSAISLRMSEAMALPSIFVATPRAPARWSPEVWRVCVAVARAKRVSAVLIVKLFRVVLNKYWLNALIKCDKKSNFRSKEFFVFHLLPINPTNH